MIDEETPTAKAFQWAARFLADNREVPFYLLIDSFAPHEPWEAPEKYYRMYAQPDYSGVTRLCSCYGPADDYSVEELADMRAHYQGLVTHVDHWVGVVVDTVDKLGLSENTAILLVSDHGTNFCENPRNVIGKPANSMYPGLMQLPLLAKMPGDRATAKLCHDIVYNVDLTATAYELAGIDSPQGLSGQSLCPLCDGNGDWQQREYVTCRYADSLCYIDNAMWALGTVDGKFQEVFDLTRDPDCMTPLAKEAAAPLWERAWKRLLSDAGGTFPGNRAAGSTDALGRGKTEFDKPPNA